MVKTGLGTVNIANQGNSFSEVSVGEGRLELGTNDDNSISKFSVASGATLAIVAGNDMAKWGGVVYDISGALELNRTRLSVSGGTFSLNGGTISGVGEGQNGALDFYGSTTVSVSGTSEISANMRVREGAIATFDIGGDASLTLSGNTYVQGEGSAFKVMGSGNLVVNGGNDGSSSVSIGSFDGYSGTVSLDKGAAGLTFSTGWSGTTSASFDVGAGVVMNITGGGLSVNEISVGEGATLNFSPVTGMLNYEKLTFASGSSFVFANGNSSSGSSIGDTDSQIEIAASGGRVSFKGSLYGNETDIQGGIFGDGTLEFAYEGKNRYKVSAGISDGVNGSLALSFALADGQSVTLSGDNSYTGGTTIASGIVVAGHDNALGGGKVTINSGAKLQLGADKNVAVKDLSGEGIIEATKASLSVTSEADTSFSGTLTGAITLVKDGVGTLTLNGETVALYSSTINPDTQLDEISAYGGVEVNGGTLAVCEGANLGSVKVEAGATLQFRPNYGVFGAIANDIVFSDGSHFTVNLNDYIGLFADSDSDVALNILKVPSLVFGDNMTLTSEVIESYFDEANSVLGKYEDLDREWAYNNEYLTLTFSSSIPEPSAFGLFAGVGALALVAARRRRRR